MPESGDIRTFACLNPSLAVAKYSHRLQGTGFLPKDRTYSAEESYKRGYVMYSQPEERFRVFVRRCWMFNRDMSSDSELKQQETKSLGEVMAWGSQTNLKPVTDAQPIPWRTAHTDVAISGKHAIQKKCELVFGQVEGDFREAIEKGQSS